uniref:Uncharacterized protein n=1 Tax=Equus asinus TaxID=9793 RepID=A0A8C4MC96_EQUAS
MPESGEKRCSELQTMGSTRPSPSSSRKSPSFTITLTSEAGENSKPVQTTFKFTYSEKHPDEAPLRCNILPGKYLEDKDVSGTLKLLALQNFLSCKARFNARLLEIKKKRVEAEQQAGES